jgi:hypothetical protein
MVGKTGDGAIAMAKPASEADPDIEPEVQVEPTAETTGFAGMPGADESNVDRANGLRDLAQV